jgi:hypothetical protein
VCRLLVEFAATDRGHGASGSERYALTARVEVQCTRRRRRFIRRPFVRAVGRICLCTRIRAEVLRRVPLLTASVSTGRNESHVGGEEASSAAGVKVCARARAR